MRAIAISPGKPDSVHTRELPSPALDGVADGRGVRVSMVRAGLCGTDADVVAGRYGRAPDGDAFLILGHESLGRVVEVGDGVDGASRTGDLVVVTIRRPGTSLHDQLGRPDLSTDAVFTEAGINGAHGFLADEVVVDHRFLVPVPAELEPIGVLTEPLSCVTKALRQADQVQTRLAVWEPRRALVIGASTIGLLASLALRLRGLEVTTCGRLPAGGRRSSLLDAIGARYVSTREIRLDALTERDGPFELVFEGSGDATMIGAAVGALAPNGVLALFSVTPGERRTEVDVARLNQAIVLYNRAIVGSAAAAHADYLAAVETLTVAERAPATRGWSARLITDRVDGLDAAAVAGSLRRRGEHIKTVVEIGKR